jgi:hypothetical protein
MLRLTLCVSSLTVTALGLSKFFDDTRRISDDTAFDEEQFTNYAAITQESAKVLEVARESRKNYKPKRTTEYTTPKTAAMRLVSQCNDYMNLFRGGHMPNIIPSPETKKWFKGLALSTKSAKDLGGNAARRGALIKKTATSPVLYVGFIVDLLDFAALIVAALKPSITWAIEPLVFFSWWGVGILVFMTEGGYDFIESGYALMQMPTTIGFGDMLPSQEQYGLKLFHAAHIMVSTIFVSGKMNYYIDKVLDFIDEKLKRESDSQKMMTSGAMLLLEGLFSTFFYAWEFNQESGQTYPLDIIDSFYMTVVALTTVGYGDFSPQTTLGRALGFFWGHFGTETAARFFDAWDGLRHTQEEREVAIENVETGKKEMIKTDVDLEDLANTLTPTTTIP